MKEDHDGAEPSGNSVSVINLVRLASMIAGNRSDRYRRDAERVLVELLNPKCAFTSDLGSVSQLLLIFLFSFSTGCFRDEIKRHGDGSTFDVLCSRHAHCSFPKASCLGWPEAFCRV